MQRRHVLVMSFVGQDGHPAPKLKDVHWTPSKLQEAFTEVLNGMTTMYRDCALVHCDLSEYNMLYWDRHVYFIDVGQVCCGQKGQEDVAGGFNLILFFPSFLHLLTGGRLEAPSCR